MRAPIRIFAISLAILAVITLFLSSFQSDTVTRTINKFPAIRQQWQARTAAMQSHFSSGSASSSKSSNAAACDADEKTCTAPYTSKDSEKDAKPMQDQTSSEYDSAEKDDKSKDSKRPSSKDEDRDKDRGFTDAEQAAALERLEFKYGEEAKADTNKVLWMESTTTTEWGADPTEALTSDAEKARKMLGEEYGDLKVTTAESDEAEATPREKGWRTTGFETKAKATAKTLISGGGGNGTATPTAVATETDDFEIVAETVTTKAKGHTRKPSQTEADEEMITGNTKGSKKPAKKPVDDEEGDEEEIYEEEVAALQKGKKPLWADDDDFITSTKKSSGKKHTATEDADEVEVTATSKGRWDD